MRQRFQFLHRDGHLYVFAVKTPDDRMGWTLYQVLVDHFWGRP